MMEKAGMHENFLLLFPYYYFYYYYVLCLLLARFAEWVCWKCLVLLTILTRPPRPRILPGGPAPILLRYSSNKEVLDMRSR